MSDAWDNTDVRDATPEEETMISTVLAQRKQIEELEKACDEWAEVSQSNYQRAKVAEAKLAKAVKCKYLNDCIEMVDELYDSSLAAKARTTLAELSSVSCANLKGQDDE